MKRSCTAAPRGGLRALAVAAALALLAPGAGAETRVVMVSIDGLRPEVYRTPDALGVRVPNLVALRDAGVRAARMLPVFPSVTYPGHTTMVTGTRPAEHRIASNFKTGLEWFRDAADIASPTLWQAARGAGMTTAVVTWPVTVGARVDFLVAEVMAFGATDLRERIRAASTPGVFEAHGKACAPEELPAFDTPEFGERLDAMSACFAAALLREERPRLLLVHWIDADHRQHGDGPDSAAAREAFERIDGHLGALREAVKDAGVEDETVFVVVGDHGFAPLHTSLNVNAMLHDAGFATLASGKLAAAPGIRVATDGGSAALYLERGADPKLAARLEAKLRATLERRYRGLVELVPASELAAMGAFPGAALALAASEGYMLGVSDSPEASLPSGALRGMHGYLPTLPSMATGFVAAGPGLRRGVELPLVRQLDVAPTVARILGVPLPSALGIPLAGAFEAR